MISNFFKEIHTSINFAGAPYARSSSLDSGLRGVISVVKDYWLNILVTASVKSAGLLFQEYHVKQPLPLSYNCSSSKWRFLN